MCNRIVAFVLLCINFSIYSPDSIADTDLNISVAVDPALIVVNSTTYFYASVSNYGVDAAQDVIVSITLPAGLTLVSAATTQGTCSGTITVNCDLGTINAGNLSVQATVTLEVTANMVATISGEFTITTSTIDSDNANNMASGMVEVVSVANSADQSVSFDTMPNWAYQGINTSFPIIVVNNGPVAATQSELTFSIPLLALADFVSATPTQGTCTTALTNCIGLGCVTALALPLSVSCDLSPLSSGGSAGISVVATTVGNVGDMLQLVALIESSSTADPNSNNNQSNISIEIIAVPDVEGGAGPGGCFIATAAYGSDMADEVKLLREFRDHHLAHYELGRNFISLYYKFSPPVAQYISTRDDLRALIRLLLYLPISVIKFPGLSLMLFVSIAGAFFGTIVYRLRKNRY